MKEINVILNILRIIATTLWRLALTAAVVIGLCCLGIAMALSMIFNGPSESARNELTLTLLESEVTKDIPAVFLGEKGVAYISAESDSLPAAVCDPALITHIAGGENRTVLVQEQTYTATVKLISDQSSLSLTDTEGENYVHFNEDGILVISTEDDGGSRCGKILLMNGQANEDLFNSQSGYAPRIAIGQTADGTLILITTDGWDSRHPGATYQDLINIMTEYGAVNACCLSSNPLI